MIILYFNLIWFDLFVSLLSCLFFTVLHQGLGTTADFLSQNFSKVFFLCTMNHKLVLLSEVSSTLLASQNSELIAEL